MFGMPDPECCSNLMYYTSFSRFEAQESLSVYLKLLSNVHVQVNISHWLFCQQTR